MGGGFGGFSPKPPTSLFLHYDSAVINTKANAASLPFTVRGSTDHGFTHGFWRWHRPWAPIGSPASAHATELSVVSGGRTDHGGQHGPLPLHRPRTPTWPRVAVQAIHNNTVLSSCSSTVPGCQHGFRLQYGQQTPVRPSLAALAVDIHTDPGCRRMMGPDMDQNQRLLTVQFSFPFLPFLTPVSSFHFPSSYLPFLPFFFQDRNLRTYSRSTAILSCCFYFPRTEQSLREGNSPRL